MVICAPGNQRPLQPDAQGRPGRWSTPSTAAPTRLPQVPAAAALVLVIITSIDKRMLASDHADNPPTSTAVLLAVAACADSGCGCRSPGSCFWVHFTAIYLPLFCLNLGRRNTALLENWPPTLLLYHPCLAFSVLTPSKFPPASTPSFPGSRYGLASNQTAWTVVGMVRALCL